MPLKRRGVSLPLRFRTSFKREDRGWRVMTYFDGVLRRHVWTSGSRREAAQLGRENRREIEYEEGLRAEKPRRRAS